ncbi:YceI family protein [Robertkochia flava]|uniref:YceI family protein n=1 Tax=Robertkochia flava TaxID=3447986 RepID=UPI001CCC501F|nr:YceI family protein [Robertkochia marina]
MRRVAAIVVLGSLLSFNASAPTIADTEVLIKDSSSLSIVGKTNVNTFKCRYDITELRDPLDVNYVTDGNAIEFNSAVLRLRNENFDCGGRGINKDFHQLLNTPKYPEVVLNLQKVVPHPRIKDNYIAGVNITIAGVTRNYDLFLKITPEDDLKIKGVLEISLPDFNLEAPEKVMGMIKVQDDLVIEFLLDLKEA